MANNKKSSILFVNRWVGYNQGGNESHIKDLIVWMSKLGHSVYLITTEGEAIDNIKDHLADVIFVKGDKKYYSYSILSFWHLLVYAVNITIAFVKLRLKHQIDVVSIHFSLEGLWWRTMKLFYNIPYVFVFAGDTVPEIIEGSYADTGIHISKYMASRSDSYGYSTMIIPKGIDKNKFTRKGSKYTDHQINPKDKIILTVCRLDPRKNLETLIKAAKILIKSNDHLKFFIVGDGVEKQKLSDLIERSNLRKNVFLLGSFTQEDPRLAQIYRTADLFALPTLYEGFGWVFLEAMASGLPIVSTIAGSNSEVLANRGYLTPVKSPSKFAEAIKKCLINKKTTRNHVKNGLLYADTLSWKKISTKYSRVYDKTSLCRKTFPQRFSDVFMGNLSQTKNIMKNFSNIITRDLVWNPDITQK